MSEIARIVDQLERAYGGDAWHGPSIREILAGVDAEMAAARPIPSAHSIRELVSHLIAWKEEAAARLVGAGSGDLPPEREWPEDATAWNAMLDELDAAHTTLVSTIGELQDDSLEQRVEGHPTSVYHLLHGVIQHELYHAGQMALLKKTT